MTAEDPYSEAFQRGMIALANRARRWCLQKIMAHAQTTRRLPTETELAAISSRALAEVVMPALADLSEKARAVALGLLLGYALSLNMTDLIDVFSRQVGLERDDPEAWLRRLLESLGEGESPPSN